MLFNYFTEMCSGSEAGSYLRLTDFVFHSTLGVRVIKKKKKDVLQRWPHHHTVEFEGFARSDFRTLRDQICTT